MTTYEHLIDYCTQQGIPFAEKEPLKNHTTFKIGGPADLMLWPRREEELARLLVLAEQANPLILGKGSNILAADGGYRGVVLVLGGDFTALKLLDERTIYAGSGATLAQLCKFALDQGLTGLEFAYGIPGSVGGAVYMNAGAYGGEMADVLVQSRHLDLRGQKGLFQSAEMELSYRTSAYCAGGLVITGAILRLRAGEPEEIRAKMEDFLGRRRDKQPLEYPSAGSTFKRPEGNYASALIDACGLKGLRVGGAVVSEKHAGFVINDGGATCADVLALVEQVRQRVLAQTGYNLDCEIKVIGL